MLKKNEINDSRIDIFREKRKEINFIDLIHTESENFQRKTKFHDFMYDWRKKLLIVGLKLISDNFGTQRSCFSKFIKQSVVKARKLGSCRKHNEHF